MSLFILLALGLAVHSASAQEAASFLKIGVGARAVGMGGAYTAIADGVDSIAWNPAGLARSGVRDLGFMHAEMVQSTRFDFLGYRQPTRFGSMGLAARHLSQGALDGRDASGAPTGGFSAADTALDLGFARSVTPSFGVGVAVRYIQSTIAETSAHGEAMDLGAIYQGGRLGPGSPQLGLAVQNIGPGMRFLDQSSPLPLTLAMGIGYKLPAGLLFAADLRNWPRSRTSEVSAGTEYAIVSGFAFRAGYSRDSTAIGTAGGLTGLTGGFGLALKNYRFDYSITPLGELGNAHRISLGTRF